MFSLSSILWVIPLLILTITACYQFKNIDHLFEALEDRFISNRPPWAAAIRKVAKFMTPFNKWRKQMRWFDKLYAAQQKEHSVFLREIYLRERGDLLRKRRDNPDGGGLTPAEKRILGMLEEEYTANEDRHEEAYVALFQTYTTRPSGLRVGVVLVRVSVAVKCDEAWTGKWEIHLILIEYFIVRPSVGVAFAGMVSMSLMRRN
ncbi:hypothetical protein MW887_003890 [Aspergillus wentii]|nr:hypothetical protein MW887_003890 [Aspergillus wentii]